MTLISSYEYGYFGSFFALNVTRSNIISMDTGDELPHFHANDSDQHEYPHINCFDKVSLDLLIKSVLGQTEMQINLYAPKINSGRDAQEMLARALYWSLVIFKLLLYTMMSLVALVSNTLIILVIVWHNNMRKSTNYYIMNLAVCDLSLVFFGMSVEIALTLSDGIWTLGSVFCKMSSFAQTASALATILTLSVISLDRYYGVMQHGGFFTRSKLTHWLRVRCFGTQQNDPGGCAGAISNSSSSNNNNAISSSPGIRREPSMLSFSGMSQCGVGQHHFNYKSYVTRHCLPIIVLIWLISLLVALPVLIYRRRSVRHWLDVTEYNCDDRYWPRVIIEDEVNGCAHVIRPLKRAYYTMLSLFLFVTPIVIMTINYFVIIKRLASRSEQPPGVMFSGQKKVIKMLVLILIVFLICWTPLDILILIHEYCLNNELPFWWHHVNWVANFLAYSSAAINPIIYAGLNENFKNSLRSLSLIARLIRSSASTTTSTNGGFFENIKGTSHKQHASANNSSSEQRVVKKSSSSSRSSSIRRAAAGNACDKSSSQQCNAPLLVTAATNIDSPTVTGTSSSPQMTKSTSIHSLKFFNTSIDGNQGRSLGKKTNNRSSK